MGLDGALSVPKLATAHDELARPARHRLQLARGPRARLGAWLYARAIGRLQRRICRKFDRVLTLSEHDRRTLLASEPGLSVGVLPFPIGINPARRPVPRARRPVCFSWGRCTVTRTWMP